MINKKTRKIDDPKAYKESGIKDAMEDLENTAEAALHSAPELDKEQVTHGDDTSKELLYGGSNDNNNNNKNKKIDIYYDDSSERI